MLRWLRIFSPIQRFAAVEGQLPSTLKELRGRASTLFCAPQLWNTFGSHRGAPRIPAIANSTGPMLDRRPKLARQAVPQFFHVPARLEPEDSIDDHKTYYDPGISGRYS